MYAIVTMIKQSHELFYWKGYGAMVLCVSHLAFQESHLQMPRQGENMTSRRVRLPKAATVFCRFPNQTALLFSRPASSQKKSRQLVSLKVISRSDSLAQKVSHQSDHRSLYGHFCKNRTCSRRVPTLICDNDAVLHFSKFFPSHSISPSFTHRPLPIRSRHNLDNK